MALGALIALWPSGFAHAQETPRTTVTLQPLSLLSGYIDLEVERALGRHVSVYVAPGGIFSSGHRLDGSWTGGLFAWSVDLGARWFPLRDAPSGPFVDLSGGYFTSWFSTGDRYRGDGGRVMLLLGYTLLAWRHLALSAGLGAQYRLMRDQHSTVFDEQWAPAFRLAVGAAF